MEIKTIENSQKVNFDLDAFILHSTPEVEIVQMLLKPREFVDNHSNPFDVIVCVIENEVEILVEGKTFSAPNFSVFHINKNLQRGLINNSDKPTRLNIIKLFYTKE